ncbi:MAG: hypothetical protein WA855_00430, partial [Candidatus Acidiferrales bacterium]
IYDADGKHYGRGEGLRILVDGTTVASSPTLAHLVAHMPASASAAESSTVNRFQATLNASAETRQ